MKARDCGWVSQSGQLSTGVGGAYFALQGIQFHDRAQPLPDPLLVVQKRKLPSFKQITERYLRSRPSSVEVVNLVFVACCSSTVRMFTSIWFHDALLRESWSGT